MQRESEMYHNVDVDVPAFLGLDKAQSGKVNVARGEQIAQHVDEM